MAVTMYHNPRCNTSRKTLALLREKGVEPTIIEYLKTPYTAAQLKQLLGQLKIPASKLVRRKEAAAAGVDPSKLSEDQLIAAMVKNPIIVERPIVVSGQKAIIRITMRAPAKPGEYKSIWILRTPTGIRFGDPFWVDIIVSRSRR